MSKAKIKDGILLGITAVSMFTAPISFYLSASFESIIPDILFTLSGGWLLAFWWSNSGLRRKDRNRNGE